MRDTGQRFEIDIEGQTVFADYRRSGSTLSIDHVESPPALRGKGAAGKLMQEIHDYAKIENLKLIPICSYAATWLQRNAS